MKVLGVQISFEGLTKDVVMIFIKKEKDNSLNKIIDCDNLNESYFPLISDISNYKFSY